MTSRVWPLIACAGVLLGCRRAPPAPSTPPAREERPVRAVRYDVVEEAVRRVDVDGCDEERPTPDAFSHAQREYRRLLWREVRAIARHIDELEVEVESASADEKPDKQHELDDARAWRKLLQTDLELIGSATATRWNAVKLHIARHLEHERPASFPTWAEKSYGI